MELRVERELPAGIQRLVDSGLGEGFRFVERLVREWDGGENRFAAPGEIFLCAYRDGELVGFGGLNRDPYCDDPRVGRIRHVYLEPAVRGHGIGAALVRELVRSARPAFSKLRLATQQAAPFYEHLGFAPASEPKATHVLALDSRPG